jgi:uncharacterized protein (TIGR02246 family)
MKAGRMNPEGAKKKSDTKPEKKSVEKSLRSCAAIAIVFLLGFFLVTARAQNPSKTEETDIAAIKQVLAAYTDGWNSRDAHALTMLFADDADYTNVNGANTNGSRAIEEMFVRLFNETGIFRQSHRTDSAKRIRFFAPGVAAVDDYWVLDGALPERPHREGLYSWVMVKQNGHWVVAVHHATEFTAAPPPAAPAGKGR